MKRVTCEDMGVDIGGWVKYGSDGGQELHWHCVTGHTDSLSGQVGGLAHGEDNVGDISCVGVHEPQPALRQCDVGNEEGVDRDGVMTGRLGKEAGGHVVDAGTGGEGGMPFIPVLDGGVGGWW